MDDLNTLRSSYLRMKGGMLKYSGSSMRPALKDGYSVKFEPVGPQDLKKGDLIVYETKDILVCHRFIKKINIKEKRYLMEKGDRNLFPWFIEENCFLGRVTEMQGQNGESIDKRKWKKIPFFSDMYSFFWPLFFMRCIIKNADKS